MLFRRDGSTSHIDLNSDLIVVRGASRGLLPFTDTFDGDGALAAPWLNAATWARVSGAAVNTPTEGANLLANAGLETWTTPTNAASWTETIAGTSTVNEESAIVHGGAKSARLDVDSSNSQADIGQVPSPALAVGDWFISRFWLRTSASGKTATIIHNNQAPGAASPLNPGTNWVQSQLTSRVVTLSGFTVNVRKLSAASASIYADDTSVNKFTFPTLMAYIAAGASDIIAKGAWTIVPSTLAGVAINLDSSTNPQNGVFLLHAGSDLATLYLWKVVAGVWTQVATATAIYVAGANVELRKNGTTYQMFYNGTQRGTNQTISDAGVISNTIAAMVSTYAGNSVTSFELVAN